MEFRVYPLKYLQAKQLSYGGGDNSNVVCVLLPAQFSVTFHIFKKYQKITQKIELQPCPNVLMTRRGGLHTWIRDA